MHTEDEAREKTCPHMRHVVNGRDVDEYKIPPVYSQSRCIASQCMAWRWLKHQYKERPGANFNDVHAADRLGYCGLSGKPE